jgi:hypothetical protein
MLVEAPPGAVYTLQIRYLGKTLLSIHHAFDIIVYVDGQNADGKTMYKDVIESFTGRRIQGGYFKIV